MSPRLIFDGVFEKKLKLISILPQVAVGLCSRCSTSRTTNHLAALPIIDNTTSVLTPEASHGGEIALTNLLPDDSSSVAEVLTEVSASETGWGGRKLLAAIAASVSRSQQSHQMLAEFRILFREGL